MRGDKDNPLELAEGEILDVHNTKFPDKFTENKFLIKCPYKATFEPEYLKQNPIQCTVDNFDNRYDDSMKMVEFRATIYDIMCILEEGYAVRVIDVNVIVELSDFLRKEVVRYEQKVTMDLNVSRNKPNWLLIAIRINDMLLDNCGELIRRSRITVKRLGIDGNRRNRLNVNGISRNSLVAKTDTSDRQLNVQEGTERGVLNKYRKIPNRREATRVGDDGPSADDLRDMVNGRR